MDAVGFALATELERTAPQGMINYAALPNVNGVYQSTAVAHDGKRKWYWFGQYSSSYYYRHARMIDMAQPNIQVTLADMPYEGGNMQAVLEPVTNRIYIFAGSSSSTKFFGYYNIATNTYSANLGNTHFGCQNGGNQRMVIADLEGGIYLYSGSDSVPFRRYNAQTQTYTNLGTAPPGLPYGAGYVTEACMIAAKTLFWVEAGGASRFAYTFSGVSNTATQRASMPSIRYDNNTGSEIVRTVFPGGETQPMYYFGVGSYGQNGKAYVTGGQQTISSTVRYNFEYFVYDLDSNTWSYPPSDNLLNRSMSNQLSNIYMATFSDFSMIIAFPQSGDVTYGALEQALMFPSSSVIDTSTLKAWLAIQ